MTSCFNFWQKSDDIQPVLRKVLLALWMVLQTDFHLAFFHQPTSLGRFADSNSIPWRVTTTLYLVLTVAKLLTCLPFIVERLFHRCHFGLGSMKCWNAVIPWFDITCSFRLSMRLFLDLPVQNEHSSPNLHPDSDSQNWHSRRCHNHERIGAKTFEVISARLSSELPRWTPASEVLFPGCTSTSLCWWFRGWCGLWCRFLHAYNRRAGNYSCLLSNTHVVSLQTSKTSSPQTLLDRMATPDAVAAANILMTAAVSYTPPAARDSTGQCGTLPKHAKMRTLSRCSWSWYPSAHWMGSGSCWAVPRVRCSPTQWRTASAAPSPWRARPIWHSPRLPWRPLWPCEWLLPLYSLPDGGPEHAGSGETPRSLSSVFGLVHCSLTRSQLTRPRFLQDPSSHTNDFNILDTGGEANAFANLVAASSLIDLVHDGDQKSKHLTFRISSECSLINIRKMLNTLQIHSRFLFL